MSRKGSVRTRGGPRALEAWARWATQGYVGVTITNMTTAWRDGLAFCAIIHKFRPDLIDFSSLQAGNILENNALAFRVAEQQLGIPALLDAEDMVASPVPDRLSVLTYVSQFYQTFSGSGLPNCIIENVKKGPVPVKKAEPDQLPQRPPKMEASPAKTDKVVGGGVRRGGSVGGGWRVRESCGGCGAGVYLAERITVGTPGQVRHRTCFRCARCQSQLTLASYYQTQRGDFCCETCPDEEVVIRPTAQDSKPRPSDSSGAEESSEESNSEEEESLASSVSSHTPSLSSQASSNAPSLASQSSNAPSSVSQPSSNTPSLTKQSFVSQSSLNTSSLSSNAPLTTPTPPKPRTVFLTRTLNDDAPSKEELLSSTRPAREPPSKFASVSPVLFGSKSIRADKDIQDSQNQGKDIKDEKENVRPVSKSNVWDDKMGPGHMNLDEMGLKHVTQDREKDRLQGTERDRLRDDKWRDSSSPDEGPIPRTNSIVAQRLKLFRELDKRKADNSGEQDERKRAISGEVPAKFLRADRSTDDDKLMVAVKSDDYKLRQVVDKRSDEEKLMGVERGNRLGDDSISDTKLMVSDEGKLIGVEKGNKLGDGCISAAVISGCDVKDVGSKKAANHLEKILHSAMTRERMEKGSVKLEKERESVSVEKQGAHIGSYLKRKSDRENQSEIKLSLKKDSERVDTEGLNNKSERETEELKKETAKESKNERLEPEKESERLTIGHNREEPETSQEVKPSAIIPSKPNVSDDQTQVSHRLTRDVVDSETSPSNAEVSEQKEYNPFDDDEGESQPYESDVINSGNTDHGALDIKRAEGRTKSQLHASLGKLGDKVVDKPDTNDDSEFDRTEKRTDTKIDREIESTDSHKPSRLSRVNDSTTDNKIDKGKMGKLADQFDISSDVGDSKSEIKKEASDSKEADSLDSTHPSVVPSIIYPDDLNPFGSDEEEDSDVGNKSESEKKESPRRLIKANLNPFSSDEDEEEEEEEEKRRKKEEDRKAQKNLNPFWSGDEEEEEGKGGGGKEKKVKPPRPPPPTLPRNSTMVLPPSPHTTPSSSPHKRTVAPLNPSSPVSSLAPCPPIGPPPPSPTGSFAVRRKGRKAPAPPSPSMHHKEVGEDEVMGWKNQKDLKNRTNRLTTATTTTTTTTTTVPPPPKPPRSPALSPPRHALGNKGDMGEWQRKKGPAPPRPVPQKRSIKKLPMRMVQQELNDIDIKQTELERQGVILETAIRKRTEEESIEEDGESKEGGPNSGPSSIEVEDMILQLFELVNEKNELFRRQTELMYMKREKRLEEEYVEIEFQIRCLMLKSPTERTEQDTATEERLIERLVKVVEQRDEIINCLEMDRLREAQEDESIATHMMQYQEKHIDVIEDTNSPHQNDESVKKKKKTALHLPKKKKKKKDKEKKKKKKGDDDDKDVDETEEGKKKKKKWLF